MFWDMTKEQRPPFQRTWVGSEVLEEKYATENYIWAHNIGAVDLTPTLKDCGIINETYMLFKDRIFNYKTGDVYRPVNGVYLLYTSKKGVLNQGAGKRVEWRLDDIEPSVLRVLPKFPQTQRFTKIYNQQ